MVVVIDMSDEQKINKDNGSSGISDTDCPSAASVPVGAEVRDSGLPDDAEADVAGTPQAPKLLHDPGPSHAGELPERSTAGNEGNHDGSIVHVPVAGHKVSYLGESGAGTSDGIKPEEDNTADAIDQVGDADVVNSDAAIPAKAEEQTGGDEMPVEELAAETVAPSDNREKDSSVKANEEGDDNDHEHDHEAHHLDYSHHSKTQMVQVLESLLKENEFGQLGRILKEVRPPYDELHQQEKEEALQKYIEQGGDADGFEYRGDELDQRFEKAYAALQDRRREYLNSQEKHREENLRKKLEILERLREVVDSEETTSSIGVLKKIQQEWRSVGPVTPKHIKTLWANYNALIDRFYDKRSIYFELKELDRKKNYELKLEICDKTEKLASEENMKEAIRQLNELHDEFKNIGPVPLEEQEAVWQRFKTASDLIYSRRKDFFDHLKEQMRLNLMAKQVLIDKANVLAQFQSDRISEWNAKTAEVLQLQKDWEHIGSIPREKSRKINKAFWASFKTFFNNKSHFFRLLEEHRRENMRLKEELLAKADDLKDSEDFEKTSEELKELQRRWKEIGPVPERHKNDIYEKFKTACDAFFSRKRERHSQFERDQNANLSRKEALCAELEGMANGKTDLERVKEIQAEWAQIGYVPRDSVKPIQMRYSSAISQLADRPEVGDNERHRLKFKSQFSKASFGPDAGRVIQKKEQALRRQISKLENEINVWRTNMDYFAQSKTADLFKAEFNKKIEEANRELQELKEQLNLLTDI